MSTEGKKPGRPTSGKSRSEIESASTKKYRNNLKESGKEVITVYVDPDTKRDLKALKTSLDLNTLGEVIDILVRKAKK